jgi:transposase
LIVKGINATLVKKFADFNSLRKTKSDKLDSKVIANFLFKNYSSLEYYKINSFNELSGFSRIRKHLVFEISKIQSIVHFEK